MAFVSAKLPSEGNEEKKAGKSVTLFEENGHKLAIIRQGSREWEARRRCALAHIHQAFKKLLITEMEVAHLWRRAKLVILCGAQNVVIEKIR